MEEMNSEPQQISEEGNVVRLCRLFFCMILDSLTFFFLIERSLLSKIPASSSFA